MGLFLRPGDGPGAAIAIDSNKNEGSFSNFGPLLALYDVADPGFHGNPDRASAYSLNFCITADYRTNAYWRQK